MSLFTTTRNEGGGGSGGDGDKKTIIKDRDQALEDLKNVENAFSDLHRKYERAKGTLENLKKNESLLILRDEQMTKRIADRDQQLQLIKEEVQKTLETMHQDYETKLQSAELENGKLRALIRKSEMKITSMENDLEHKNRENAQLHSLCDELIHNQGSSKGEKNTSLKI